MSGPRDHKGTFLLRTSAAFLSLPASSISPAPQGVPASAPPPTPPLLFPNPGLSGSAPSSGGMESRQRRELESSTALSRKEGGQELPRITRGWGAGETSMKPGQPGLGTRALGGRDQSRGSGVGGRGGPRGIQPWAEGKHFPGPCPRPRSVEGTSWGSLSLPVPTGREPPAQVAFVQASGTPRSLPREHPISLPGLRPG